MTAIIIISKEKPYLVKIISEDTEETFEVENLYIQYEAFDFMDTLVATKEAKEEQK